MSRVDEIVRHLDGKKEGNSWRCRCPCHDNQRHLSVTEKEGRTLVYCHGGAEQREVIQALKDEGLWS